jgi:hypothetical protein
VGEQTVSILKAKEEKLTYKRCRRSCKRSGFKAVVEMRNSETRGFKW